MESKEQSQPEDNGIYYLMQWSQCFKYKKITIDHDIYIKCFSYGTVSYLTVYTDDVLNTTNNENAFPELTRVFKEHFAMKVQEG